jgi:hypothetical protein
MSIRLKVVRAPQMDGTRHGRHARLLVNPEPLALSFRGTTGMAGTTALDLPGHAGMIGRRCLLRLLSFRAMLLRGAGPSVGRARAFDRSFLFWAEPCETISPAQPISQMRPSRISICFCSQRDSPLPTRSLLRRDNSPALCGSGARSGPREQLVAILYRV